MLEDGQRLRIDRASLWENLPTLQQTSQNMELRMAMLSRITVILCTYNRCASLAKALKSVAIQELPESVEWEILVVDNNSSDQTREVVADFISRHPGRCHYLFEAQQGLSHARNAGIREARGDVIAFMDDDTIMAPTWLQNLTASLHNGEWAGAGGRILPQWTCSRPRWFSIEGRHPQGPLAVFDLGPESGELKEPPFGANMAFRKTMFDQYGGFRTDLGRRAGSLMSNEDTEFGLRLLAGGERFRYEPSAVVYHPVPQSRLQKKYFLAWWFSKGRADVRQYGIPKNATWYIRGVPLYLLRRLVRWTVEWLVTVGPSSRFSCRLKVWEKLGAIVECYRQHLNVKKKTESI